MALIQIRDQDSQLADCLSRAPSVVSDNSHLLLLLSAKAQLSRGEQTVDDQYILVDAIVDEFGLAILADDEQRRHFALTDRGRELDVGLAAVIVGIDRPPRRAIALYDVPIAALIDFGDDGR